MFATGTSLCWRCYKANKICSRTCSRCDQQLSIENFDNKNVSAYDAKEMKFLVCKVCYEKGYRYDNIEEIRCRHGHSRGRAAFDKQSLKDLQKRGAIPACLSCQSQQVCEACKVRKDPDKFDKLILMNARTYSRKLVCLACQAIGYSPRDCATYLCAGSQTTETPSSLAPQVYKCRLNPIQKERSKCDPFLLHRLRRAAHSAERTKTAHAYFHTRSSEARYFRREQLIAHIAT